MLAGQGWAGPQQGEAVQQGRAGLGRAGQGRAGQGNATAKECQGQGRALTFLGC